VAILAKDDPLANGKCRFDLRQVHGRNVALFMAASPSAMPPSRQSKKLKSSAFDARHQNLP
jgi:hypothetical protein